MAVLFKNLENRNKKIKIAWFKKWAKKADNIGK